MLQVNVIKVLTNAITQLRQGMDQVLNFALVAEPYVYMEPLPVPRKSDISFDNR